MMGSLCNLGSINTTSVVTKFFVSIKDESVMTQRLCTDGSGRILSNK